MINYRSGNILESDAEALVNTVNTKGIMGKGIALQFRKAYPAMYKAYLKACESGEVEIGKLFVYDLGQLYKPRYIINFPTKIDWHAKSKIEYIREGLKALAAEIQRLHIQSISIPPLGCGYGGLKWHDVKREIEMALWDFSNMEITVFTPDYDVDPAHLVNHTERPAMNHSRATVLQLLKSYCVLGYELTLLEVQKLLYLFQEIGEPLKLRFAKDRFGPYADNIRHVLDKFEGHFTRGYADGKNSPKTVINLIPEALTSASDYLNGEGKSSEESIARLNSVQELINGFESPYGLELLCSIHWLIKHEHVKPEVDDIVVALRKWNIRKSDMMKREHVVKAINRLRNSGWI